MDGVAIAGELFGVDRIENELLVLHQRMDQRSFALLDGDGDRFAEKAPSQFGHPFVDGLRRLLERVDLRPIVLIDDADDVLGVGSVDSHDDGVRELLWRVGLLTLFVHDHLG